MNERLQITHAELLKRHKIVSDGNCRFEDVDRSRNLTQAVSRVRSSARRKLEAVTVVSVTPRNAFHQNDRQVRDFWVEGPAPDALVVVCGDSISYIFNISAKVFHPDKHTRCWLNGKSLPSSSTSSS